MIYEKVKAMCDEKGIAISTLEKAVGLGNGTIAGWRTCDPRAGGLKRVADFFGVSLDDFFAPNIPQDQSDKTDK